MPSRIEAEHQRFCFLVCEGWPSWLFLLGSLGLTCNKVFIKSFKVSWLSTVQLHFPDLTWLALPRRFDLQNSCLVLMSGTTEWCFSCYSRGLHSLPCVLAAEDAPSPRFASFADFVFHSFRHTDAGGVTNGFWALGSNSAWRSFWTPARSSPQAPYQRRLRHVIESTDRLIRLQPCPPPLDDATEFPEPTFLSRQVLNWNSPLPREAPLTRVCCRSTFSPTGWVIRILSPIELGRAFDVPSSLLQWCGTWSPAHVGSLPFLNAVPPRVLCQAWHFFQGCLSSTGGGCR